MARRITNVMMKISKKLFYLQGRHLELLVAKLLHKLVYLGALNGFGGCELLQGLISHRGKQQHELRTEKQ